MYGYEVCIDYPNYSGYHKWLLLQLILLSNDCKTMLGSELFCDHTLVCCSTQNAQMLAGNICSTGGGLAMTVP
jgi:hypothetical protein